MSEYAGQQFVGTDLHRRRSVIVRTTDAGEVLETVRIVNDVGHLTHNPPDDRPRACSLWRGRRASR